MTTTDRRRFLAATLAAASTTPAWGATWNQWRGPTRDGQIDGQNAWPANLNQLEVVWRVDLQPSYSGPIVSDDCVYVTETIDAKDEAATAYSISNGERLWQARWSGAMKVPFFAQSNGSWIRSTPAVSGNRLLVGGMRDVLVCLAADTGDEIWRNDFTQTQKTKMQSFGLVCSPLIVGEHVFVQAGGGLLKLELETGKVVWRTLEDGGGMNGGAFSSPVMATLDGVEQLVVQTRSQLAGINPVDGVKLWSTDVPAFRGMNILPPTVFGNSVFTSSYGGGSFCYDVAQTDNVWKVAQKWKNTVQGYMSSPMVHDEHVYLHLKNRRYTCMDLKTGSQKWSSKPFGKYWSSVVNGNRMLALDERGELLLSEFNSEAFKLVEQRNVATDSWAHLAVVDDLIFVRDLNALIVHRWS